MKRRVLSPTVKVRETQYNSSMAHPPKNLQAILWSVDVNQLDLEKDKGYIISQILLYGDLDELKWLFTAYGQKGVTDVFLKQPMKMYFKQPFHFIKNHLLPLANTPLDEEDYVTSIFGPVRQRTANSV